MPIHDISRPIHPGMAVWPGDPEVAVAPAASIAAGDAVNLSRLTLGSHTGTHVDAPLHFLAGGGSVDDLDLSLLIGDATVVWLGGEKIIDRTALSGAGVPDDTLRLLVKTRDRSTGGAWSDAFDPAYAYLSEAAVRWVIERGIRVLGIDTPSVDGFHETGGANHRLLLTSGVIIIEGLDLAAVQPGSYRLCCLPLRLRSGDGAPARAVLIE